MPDTMDLWASRVKNADPATYVGEVNRIFYYPDSGTLRISDGQTPGGLPINLTGNTTDLAFGNFIFSNTTITTSSANSDIVIVANGTGNVNIPSPFNVYALGNLLAPPSFSAAESGEITMLVPEVGNTSGVNIIGSTTGTELTPEVTGVMLQITGQQSDRSLLYLDGVDNYPVFVGRRYNGTVGSPTSVNSGDTIVRYGSNAYDGTSFPDLGVGRIEIKATENHTPSAKGTQLEFYTVPVGETVPVRQGYYDGTGLTAINVTTTGRLRAINTNITTSQAVLEVTANESGLTKIPVLGGTIAQFTNKDNIIGAMLLDGYGNANGAATGTKVVFRTARGTNASPAAVQNNDVIGQVSAAAWGTTGYGGVDAASLKFFATDTFSDTNRPTRAGIWLVPPNSNTPEEVLSITPTSLTMTTGSTLTGWLNVPGGTSDTSPITFNAGTLPNVAQPGTLNYDGRVIYATPIDQERGIMPAQQQYVLNAVRNLTAGTTNPQSIFGVRVSLSANTRYYYQMRFQVAKNGSAANEPTLNYSLLLEGGLTLFSHQYTVTSSVTATQAAVTTAGNMTNYITTGFDTGVPVTATMPINVSYATVEIRGYIDTSVAGFATPRIAFSAAPNTSCSIQPKGAIFIYPVSQADTVTSVGNWA